MVLRFALKWGSIILAGLYISPLHSQSLHFVTDTNDVWNGHVIVKNLNKKQLDLLNSQTDSSRAWPNYLRVYTGKSAAEQQPQIVGDYLLQGTTFIFRPRYALESGLDYYAVFMSKPILEMSFSPPRSTAHSAPLIQSIYPSGTQLPANIIRFYVHFSTPMRKDNPYQYINIIAENGDTLENVIYPAKPALWGKDGKRLTVLLDPGRIKRGLPAHEKWGLALAPGEKYALVIGKQLMNQWGVALQDALVHSFQVVDEDHQSPQLPDWTLSIPAAGTLDALQIAFDEPLDQAQCLRWIQIKQKHAGAVRGLLVLKDYEQTALFTPDIPWKVGEYLLQVYNNLEDRSGNSLRKPFEVDSSYDKEVEKQTWESIPFVVK